MSGPSNCKHIVVVDDSQEILDLFKEILEGEGGYSVTICAYKPRILDDLKDLRPDMVISDHIFGEEKIGWQLVQRLRMDRDTEHIPVIVCSAAAADLREMEGHLTEKQVGLLYKPFNIDELLDLVARMFEEAGEQRVS